MQINNFELSPARMYERINLPTVPMWEQEVYRFLLKWNSKTGSVLQKTSGSTGVPKTIRLKKVSMVDSARNTIEYFRLKPGQNLLLCLPVGYIAGKMMIVRASVGKMNLLVAEPKGTPDIPDQVIDFAAMVPLQIHNLIKSSFDFKQIKIIIVGGASIGHPLLKSIQDIPSEVYATYGMTETCSHIAIQRINGESPDEVFRVLPNISITKNDRGCLCINAPYISDKLIHTNDLVDIVAPGAFRWLGRADHVVNSGGVKILPEQLEHQIASITGLECLIVSEPDELLGSRIVMLLEGSPEQTEVSFLLDQIEKKLGKHFLPKNVRFVDQFKRNKNMKIDRPFYSAKHNTGKIN